MSASPFGSLWNAPDSKAFANPFIMLTDQYVPTNITNCMQYCEFIYHLNGTYRQASRRMARYFITELQTKGEASQKESTDIVDYMTDELKIKEEIGRLGDDFSCYGNAFRFVYLPFDRFLLDPERPNVEYPVQLFGMKVQLEKEGDNLYYVVINPRTKKKCRMKFVDRKSLDRSRISLMTLDPKLVTILHNLMTGRNRYVWTFPNALKDAINSGDSESINSTPIPILLAIKNNQRFLFQEGEIFHMKAPIIAGFYSGGWGLPDTIANIRDIHQIQVYRRLDEAVGLDYVLPLRLLMPTADVNPADASNFVNLARWKSILQSVVATHRKDPAAWSIVPFSVKYEALGGEGKELAPKDLHQFSQDNLLNSMGFMAELFRGSMQFQCMPTALRLLESTWSHVPSGYNDYLKFIMDKIAPYLGLQKVKVKLASVKYADNIERNPFYMQMYGSGEMSRSTLWKLFGVEDPLAERERRIKEDSEIRKKEQEAAEQESKEQMGLGQEQGGTGGGGGNVTPMDRESQAIQIAQKLLSEPAEARRSELLALGKSDATLHALVKSQLEKQRNAIGQDAINQTANGGGAPPA